MIKTHECAGHSPPHGKERPKHRCASPLCVHSGYLQVFECVCGMGLFIGRSFSLSLPCLFIRSCGVCPPSIRCTNCVRSSLFPVHSLSYSCFCACSVCVRARTCMQECARLCACVWSRVCVMCVCVCDVCVCDGCVCVSVSYIRTNISCI